jgi:5'-3' exoribonuclease 2
MGVLPAASGACLPYACRVKMTAEDSPILDFYPEDFPLDFNGKKYEWLAVAVLPFIDEDRLRKVMIVRSHSVVCCLM